MSEGLSIFLVIGYIPGTLLIPSSKEYYVPAMPDFSILLYFLVVDYPSFCSVTVSIEL